MNRDLMLGAFIGLGVGALISSEQGRQVLGSLAKTPLAQTIGEGAMNMLNAKITPEKNEAVSTQDAAQGA